MRIISGSSKGHRLSTLKGQSVRPTADRVRESIFNIIGASIEGKKVLDLFAGFGALGLEALSRGAESAIFVEKSRKASQIIRDNFEKMGYENADIYTLDVFRFLTLPKMKNQKFNYIFSDPPYSYYEKIWIRDLWLGVSNFLDIEGQFILEHPLKWGAPEIAGGLKKKDTRKYGQTAVSFYQL